MEWGGIIVYVVMKIFKIERDRRMRYKKEKIGKIRVLKSCGCISDFQDKAYGKTYRIHNFTSKGIRCTVCGSLKSK